MTPPKKYNPYRVLGEVVKDPTSPKERWYTKIKRQINPLDMLVFVQICVSMPIIMYHCIICYAITIRYIVAGKWIGIMFFVASTLELLVVMLATTLIIDIIQTWKKLL